MPDYRKPFPEGAPQLPDDHFYRLKRYQRVVVVDIVKLDTYIWTPIVRRWLVLSEGEPETRTQEYWVAQTTVTEAELLDNGVVFAMEKVWDKWQERQALSRMLGEYDGQPST